MAFPVLETPRTELADHTRLSNAVDLDYSTRNSIPSPSKESNDLLKQIRGMRGQDGRSPRSRVPLAERRNAPSKNEFTPLLKSATRNRLMQSTNFEKENAPLHTPAALKASYASHGSPDLPLNSSVLFDDHSGSFAADREREETPAMPVSSSSALSTPMAILPHRGEGPLDHGRNLATLREQEARLEQIDKENFSLKLKIHFMEEALRRNGKEFNEAAIKENTELKVDKVTLQRDLKHYRKCLAQAEKDLEDYKKQLLDYAEKVKRRHMSEGMQQELDQLRQTISEKEAEIEDLKRRLADSEEQSTDTQKLHDQIGDLEADLREKERIIDEQDEELQNLKETAASVNDIDQRLQEKDDLLAEKDEDIQGLQDALQAANTETERRLQEKDRLLEEKDDELRELEEQVKNVDQEDSTLLRSKAKESQDKDRLIEDLQDRLRDAEEKLEQLNELQERAEIAESNLEAEKRNKNRIAENKDYEIHALEQKLQSQEPHNSKVGGQQDVIDDLEADKRELERQIGDHEDRLDQKDIEINNLRDQVKHLEDAEDELVKAREQIEDLEIKQERHVKDIQSFRDAANSPSRNGSQALKDTQDKVRELESQQDDDRVRERQLQHDLNQLRGELERARQTLRDMEAEVENNQSRWNTERHQLEEASKAAEEKSASLQRTITQLHQIEGTLSGRELQLQNELQDEKQRHTKDEALLKQSIEELRTSNREQAYTLEEAKAKLVKAQAELDDTKDQESVLQDKIQALEDEIELLESSVDEDVNRLTDELQTANNEVEQLHGRIRELQQNHFKAQNDLSKARAEIEVLEDSQPKRNSPDSPRQRELKSLQDQLSQLCKDRQNLENRLIDSEATAANAKAELETLQQDMKSSSGSKKGLQQRIQELQSQLAISKKEKQDLQDELTLCTTDLDALQTTVAEVEKSRDAVQKQLKDLRTQLRTAQTDAEQKFQHQLAESDKEMQNLEQDLNIAQTKQQELTASNRAAEQTITRLKSKVASLEKDLTTARANKTDRDTSFGERKDLHELLKEAKLEAEDLSMQIQQRDSTIDAAFKKESELRNQLKKVRSQRGAQTDRANTILKEFERLQEAQSYLVHELASLQVLSRQVRPNGDGNEPLEKAERRHAAELRGLVKQIEYLTARCRREAAFRSDLGFMKQYFTKQVETYSKCNKADLKLVKAMGIRTDLILQQQQVEAASKVGRVEVESRKHRSTVLKRTRPSLKCVALMVLASVKMRHSAQKWQTVTKSHEVLLQKLQGLRKSRTVAAEGAAFKNENASKALKRRKPGMSTANTEAGRKHIGHRALKEVTNR